jgi:phosphoglycerol transferase MdoB-like AlkP superfamily enzyme
VGAEAEANVQKTAGRPRIDLPRGAAFSAAHLAFSLIVQVEIYLLDIRRLGEEALSALSFISTLPFLQLEHLMVAAVPGMLAALCWSRPTLRWLPQLTLLSLNGWLILDQAVYGVFFDHINFSMNDAAVGAVPAMLPSLWDSVLVELDSITALNLGICALLSLWVRRANPTVDVQLGGSSRQRWLIGTWAIASLVMSFSVDNHGLEHHAVASLWRGALSDRPPEQPEEISDEYLYRLAFGKAQAEPEVDAALLRALKELQKRRSDLNVLLVMMESVGALQLFPEGRISADRTPFLAKHLENGIAFTSVYVTFPGTVRSLASLHTGGPTITWGSVYDELAHEYSGPTLVSALARMGYRTAFFSVGDMNFENLDGFMAGLGFGKIASAETKPKAWRAAHRLHSWGVTDDALREEAVDWMARVHAEGRPFFAEYITVSTHHPYSVPSPYQDGAGDDPKSRYLRALRYSDAFLGRMLAGMERRGLLENTLILVMGDHGEAFGERHRGNFTHKNFLYEENIRSFLILLAPGMFEGSIVSDRVAAAGDVLPTLLRALGAQVADLPGQSLWPSHYEPRPVFFHKNAHPELWGLREGQWKFVARRSGEKRAELYDLELDPGEQRNRATLHPERIDLYDKLCAKWFALSNRLFVERLRGYETPGGQLLASSELGSTGPKRLVVGSRDSGGRFIHRPSIRPTDLPVAWTLWVPYAKSRTIRYAWTSPSGETWSSLFTLDPDWSRTRVNYSGPFPLTKGRWQLTLWDRDEALLSAPFEVTHSAPSG